MVTYAPGCPKNDSQNETINLLSVTSAHHGLIPFKGSVSPGFALPGLASGTSASDAAIPLIIPKMPKTT